MREGCVLRWNSIFTLYSLYIYQIPLKKKKTTENLLADSEYPNGDAIREAFDLMLRIVIWKMGSSYHPSSYLRSTVFKISDGSLSFFLSNFYLSARTFLARIHICNCWKKPNATSEPLLVFLYLLTFLLTFLFFHRETLFAMLIST